MKFNYSKLKGKIVEVFGTQRNFATAIGLSERSVSLKLNNITEFSQDEIFKIVQALGIDWNQIHDYFFTQYVQ